MHNLQHGGFQADIIQDLSQLLKVIGITICDIDLNASYIESALIFINCHAYTYRNLAF
jgi:hypothetical protein